MKVHSTIQLQANDGILLCQIPRMEMSFILLSGLLLTPWLKTQHMKSMPTDQIIDNNSLHDISWWKRFFNQESRAKRQ